MCISKTQQAAFRQQAGTLGELDVTTYQAFGKPPLEPIIGLGPRDARVGFFGRDPGRDEVRHGLPFIGAGGQMLRAALYRHLHGGDMPDFEASVAVGKPFFWANTVPYKPIGNRAWSMRAKKAFQPLMANLLVHNWDGEHLITLGREAFLWFGIHQPKEVRDALSTFWTSAERFESSIPLRVSASDGTERTLRLHPLPHPSPLNATWYKRFPGLLTARLQALGVDADHLTVPAPGAR